MREPKERSPKKRNYVQKRRAESQEATRQRIIDAAVALHESVGPRNTSISAIAEHAGVQRLTVYRHFPNETEIFRACTSHWLAQHPPPDPAGWSDAEGIDRVRTALAAFYRYYRGTEAMWTASHRDEAEVEALRGPMQAFRAGLAAIARDLAEPLSISGGRADVAATIGHALAFTTWQSLAGLGLDDAAAADLVCGWLTGLGAVAKTPREVR